MNDFYTRLKLDIKSESLKFFVFDFVQIGGSTKHTINERTKMIDVFVLELYFPMIKK